MCGKWIYKTNFVVFLSIYIYFWQYLDVGNRFNPKNVDDVKAIVKFVVDLHFVDGLKISSYAPAPMALAEALHGFIDWAAVSFFYI